jgi:hypothetical protein
VASAHLRGVVIAAALAALALGLGFVTLAMNHTASKTTEPHVVLSLKARHKLAAAKHPSSVAKTLPAMKGKATPTITHAKAEPATKATPKPKPTSKAHAKPRPNPNVTAALKAGLPHSIAVALGKQPVVVVELTSKHDSVAELAAGEAKAGAALAGAGYVAVNVDTDGGDASTLTRALGKLPTAPAVLVYMRPATVAVTLNGFNDRTAVQQAVAEATPQSSGAAAAATSAWAAKADAVCSKYASAAQAQGGVLLLYATNLPVVLTLYRKQQAELKALKPPTSAARDIRAANAKIDDALSMLAATKAKTAIAVPQTTFEGAATLLEKASATYAKYGSAVCAAQ